MHDTPPNHLAFDTNEYQNERHPRDLDTWGLDELITLEQAAKDLPGSRDVSTLYRWAEKGLNGVYLTCVCVGHQRHTTHEWLKDFLVACAAARNKKSYPDIPFTPQVRTKKPKEAPERDDEEERLRDTLRRHGLNPDEGSDS